VLTATEINSEKLAPVPLRQELAGRLRNMGKLKHWQMAVAEAIHNALDATAGSGRSCEISVEIERGSDLATSGGGGKPVMAVVVSDDGVGFGEENFISFCTPDSRQKEKGGGKGLGRLTCLQAFRRIRVHSVFKDGDGWKERELVLQCESPELQAKESASSATAFYTEVRLEELRPEFEAGAAIGFDDLAEWLAEHLRLAITSFAPFATPFHPTGKAIWSGSWREDASLMRTLSHWSFIFRIWGAFHRHGPISF
jgi:anti-sigma regulatory factor (Ser/Thr protein kinase)